ncbi:hypothetical protein BKA82DRAFT_36851 [Pisolithus tinctorius]|uniref:BAH domain-containing protein n=1 Tax=Pisolithus tinctorius Marx 270 TaxID=870435 RepID=A0A0C3I636_PISTI|nr:hypothetical protein BKA82DRAFT_4021237 [Pisolithus tinctorius]KAI6138973.1 hypothetical protein BKA82DRAFT_36851 [Pisolithus tinctorius]KIN92672.1 hypothetical protein M404DRAFT_36851 [Pisolithus tinctorius Marx 270]
MAASSATLSEISVSANMTLSLMSQPPCVDELPRYDSLRYVYDTDDHNQLPTTVSYHRNQTVSIFPSTGLVTGSDGELTVTYFWYARIRRFYVQRCGRHNMVWVRVRWFYSRDDIERYHPRLGACMGEYELVESDHYSVIDIRCIVRCKYIRQLLTPTEVTYAGQLFYRYSIHVDIAETEDGEQYPVDMRILHVTIADVIEVGRPLVAEDLSSSEP